MMGLVFTTFYSHVEDRYTLSRPTIVPYAIGCRQPSCIDSQEGGGFLVDHTAKQRMWAPNLEAILLPFINRISPQGGAEL